MRNFYLSFCFCLLLLIAAVQLFTGAIIVTEDTSSKQYRPVSISFKISARANRYLTEAINRSGRSKLQEARLRLEDHLLRFMDIATISGGVSKRAQDGNE